MAGDILYKKYEFNNLWNEDSGGYDKIDGIFAIFFWLFMQAAYIVFVDPGRNLTIREAIYRVNLKVFPNFSLATRFSQFVSYQLLPLAQCILPVIVMAIYMLIRKQGIRTLGLKSKNNLKGIVFGFPGAAVAISFGLLLQCLFDPRHTQIHWEKLQFSFHELIQNLVLIGLYEEITFRAFLMSRMGGLIKNKWLLILVVGVMFWESHLYNDILSGGFIATMYVYQAFSMILFHIWCLYLYKRTDNILTAAVCHGLYDFIILTAY